MLRAFQVFEMVLTLPQFLTCCNFHGISLAGLLKQAIKSSRDPSALIVYRFRVIRSSCLSPALPSLTSLLQNHYVVLIVLTVNKSCWNVMATLIQTQVVMQRDSCLYYQYNQINICFNSYMHLLNTLYFAVNRPNAFSMVRLACESL